MTYSHLTPDEKALLDKQGVDVAIRAFCLSEFKGLSPEEVRFENWRSPWGDLDQVRAVIELGRKLVASHPITYATIRGSL